MADKLSRLQKWILVNTLIQRKLAFCHKTMRDRLYYLERRDIYRDFFGQGKDKRPIETKVRVTVTRSLKNLEAKRYIDTEGAGQKLFLTEQGRRKGKALMKEALIVVIRK